MKAYGWIGIGCLTLAVFLCLLAVRLTKKQSAARNLKDNSRLGSTLAISLYGKILNIPVLRSLLLKIRKRLEVYSDSDEKVLRKRAVSLLIITLSVFLGLLMAFWFITRDIFLFILFAGLLSFIGDTAVEIFIHNLQTRLLKQQVYYLEVLRHKYYEQKSVEDANYEACDLLNQKGSFEIYTQAERINDILTASDMETELERYYETAPNKYLKMLAGILYITKEYGDTQIQGGSVFVRCMAYLGNEIKAEIYKREKLKYALKSLNFIALVPLFCIKPLKNWACESFTPLESFYASKLGIVLAIFTLIITIGAYMTLRRLQCFEKGTRGGLGGKTLEQRLYSAGLYRLVDRLVPPGYTREYNRLTELIKSAMAPLNCYTLCARRLIYGVACFFLSLGLILGLNAYSRHAILYMPQMPQGFLGGKLSEEEYAKLQAIADADRMVIEKLRSDASEAEIYEAVSQNGVLDSAEAKVAVERIRGKLNALRSNIFWWWHLIICFAFFGVGYTIPIWNLMFLARVRKIDMEEEISQFQTIILMLMHMNRVHVEEILEWMETFSVHFKDPLQKCLSNFSSGQSKALEELKEDVAFPPFISLVDNLQLACEDLGVARAFEELENEMAFNSQSRKESNERIVEKRKNLGNMIGFLPLYALMVLYLIIPMIVTGLESLSAFYKQLSQF
jgi:hypothetical protein